MLKKILALITLMSLCASFCSCSLSASDVKLFDAEECKKYVEENYFPCELVSEDKQEEINIYTFKDPELDLTFTVKCQPSGQGMDGTAFYYDQSVCCDYDEVYYNFLRDSISGETDALSEKYGMKIEWQERFYKQIAVVYFDDEDEDKCKAAVSELAKLITDADKRNRYSDCEIYCVGGLSYLGTYYFNGMRFMKEEENQIIDEDN